MEASYEGGQGPEGAVASYMVWNIHVDLQVKYPLFVTF